MMNKTIVAIAVAVFSATGAWAQSSVAAPLAGDALRATFGEATQPKNNLTTTINVNTQIDDNALNDNRFPLTDAISNFSPNFAWSLTRQRWSLQTDYTPSFTYSLEIPRYNTLAHSLNNQLSIRLAQHTNLRFRNAFLRTSDPFGRFSQSQLVPSFGVLDQMNQAMFGPPSLFTTEQTGMDLTYMPAAHTTIGVSGTYGLNSYEDLAATSQIDRDTHIASGRTFIDQKLSPRQSVSLAYDYQVITSAAFGRTATQSVLLFDNWQLNPHFQVSLFGGPQYVDVRNSFAVVSALALKQGLGWSAGGTLGWNGQRTGVSVNVVRRVSDGGGLGGAVQMTEFSGNVSQKITKNWGTTFFAGYTLNGSNSTLNSSNPVVSSFSGGLGINRAIGQNVSAQVRYWYTHQGYDGATLLPVLLSDHNRVEIGLRYSFSHSLGR